MLVTFEGIEGVGKTTQFDLLCQELKRKKIPFISVREPGGTRLSEEIRKLLLSPSFSPSSMTELLLFEAARAELVKDVILPALSEKKVVICDRFTDSTIAYQGYGRGLPLGLIRIVNNFVTKGVIINRTYLLDLDLKDMLERTKQKKRDRIEREDMAFHSRVRKGFLAIAKKNPERVMVIDATKDIEEIHNLIKDDFFKLYASLR